MEIEWLKDFKRVVLLNPYRRPFLVAIVYKNNPLQASLIPFFRFVF